MFGNRTQAIGADSFAGRGNQTAAHGQFSFTYGNAAKAHFNHSIAFGVGSDSPVRRGVVLGRFNKYTKTNFTSGTNSTNSLGNHIFQVG